MGTNKSADEEYSAVQLNEFNEQYRTQRLISEIGMAMTVIRTGEEE